MYPVLNNCRVRGSLEDGFFLQNYLTGEAFQLEKLHADILWQCNGSKTIAELASLSNESQEDIADFLKVVEDGNLLVWNQTPSHIQFPSLTIGPYLEEVQLEITSFCNLWCKHCYGRKEFLDMEKQQMEFKNLQSFIGQMGISNVSHCFLSGGEAFTYKELPAVIKMIADERICIRGIFTNGTIWRDDVIETLREEGMMPTFLISLDGASSLTHDYIRGNGVFEKAIDFIRKVKSVGFRVTVNTVVMKPNIHELLRMYDLMLELGINRWRLAVPREQGEAIANRELIIPEWKDVFDVYEKMLTRGLENPHEIKLQLSSIFKTEFAIEKRYYLMDGKNGCCEYKRSSLVLKPNGNLVNCPAAACFPFGNVAKESLLEIWSSEITQAFKRLPIELTACSDCKIRQFCGAGCRMTAWQLHGDYLAKDENSCPLYHFFSERVRPLFHKYGIEEMTLSTSKETFDSKNLLAYFQN